MVVHFISLVHCQHDEHLADNDGVSVGGGYFTRIELEH